jgi:glutamine amidotransferase
MPVSLGLLTSDPNLLRCELLRLEGEVLLSEGNCNAVGVGSYTQDDVLLQRYPAHRTLRELSQLSLLRESHSLLYHARWVPGGMSREGDTPPLRFRGWLFCSRGVVDQFQRIRTKIWGSLPNFLQRRIHCQTESEALFALFLKALREGTRIDDPLINPTLAAQLLAGAVRTLEQFSKDAGAPKSTMMNGIATNGRLLVATRQGGGALAYRLLEGSSECARCGIGTSSPDSLPLVRAHRRRKTVAIASHVARPTSWIEIPDGTALAIGSDLDIQSVSL